MKKFLNPVQISERVTLGNGKLVIFAGPCSIESEAMVMEVANYLAEISSDLGVQLVFKSSFDKANRTSATSFRSAGIDEGLRILSRVKSEFGLPIVTDVHETAQIAAVSQVVDVIQIPAFLSRQTDLLVAAGETGLAVNIKKGQFLSPYDMEYAAAKVNAVSKSRVFLTERGTTFGYGDLVVDFRSLPIMRSFAPVVYDVTHSIQQPGSLGGKSGGQSWLAPPLARAAVAVGIDGLFIETHPDPESALSDGPNMIRTSKLADVLKSLLEIHALAS